MFETKFVEELKVLRRRRTAKRRWLVGKPTDFQTRMFSSMSIERFRFASLGDSVHS
jgi:hypothetical protein